jgi:hypothetical protein
MTKTLIDRKADEIQRISRNKNMTRSVALELAQEYLEQCNIWGVKPKINGKD